MNGRTRTILALALSTAMLAPAAFAQKGGKAEVRTTGNATSQAAREMPRPTLPPQAAGRAADATKDVASPPRPADAKDWKDAASAADAPTSQGLPPTSQGAAHAAAHSSVVQRDAWTRLDTDGDGRISPTEADVDSSFDTGFDAMDADDDGFVSDAEYRASAKVDASQGASHAAAHSSVVQRDVWTRLDADGDGRISTGEADADTVFDGGFDAMDADDDGFVSDTEYRTFAKVDAPQGAAHAAGHSAVVQRDVWARLDADADGRISATEADADAGFDSGFPVMDGNSDGFVTDAEFRAHAKATRTP